MRKATYSSSSSLSLFLSLILPRLHPLEFAILFLELYGNINLVSHRRLDLQSPPESLSYHLQLSFGLR
jgi:hypothetical protein